MHRYIDLVDFNPFLEDGMKIAFSLRGEINGDSRIDYAQTQIYPTLIYARSSENTELPQYTIVPLQ